MTIQQPPNDSLDCNRKNIEGINNVHQILDVKSKIWEF